MIPSIEPLPRLSRNRSTVWILSRATELSELPFDDHDLRLVRKRFTSDEKRLHMTGPLGDPHFIAFLKTGKDLYWRLEQARILGNSLLQWISEHKVEEVQLVHPGTMAPEALAFTEGLALGSYSFLKYKGGKAGLPSSLSRLRVRIPGIGTEELDTLNHHLQATAWARDLVNEPLNNLNAQQLAENIRARCQPVGITVEILSKKRIEALKMGGLLAVNKGSLDPPTFTIMEWKSPVASPSRPVILVGKGVVYDTGGMSLKPSSGMETMKSDMAGAAAVAAAVFAAALNRVPAHIIALIPATDNRTDGNAYVPGDVVRMYDGTTVEVLNTDAEGRMILADALAYAQKFNPLLVINVATLTGSAQRATGRYAMVGMQSGARGHMDKLIRTGELTGERIVEFPLWEEYAESLKSDIADVRNIGNAEAGAITAGKFLERFTDYPFIHLDIAGTAFAEKSFNYRGKGGTGSGVRLLAEYLREVAGISL